MTITTAQLIDLLNEDLANEFAAVIQYTTYAAKATGLARPELVRFFQQEIPEEQAHAAFLANKIIVLGGEPTTQSAPVAVVSGNKAMLEAVLVAETKAVAAYTQRAEQAATLGLKALALDLEDMIRDETNHKEQTELLLKGWV